MSEGCCGRQKVCCQNDDKPKQVTELRVCVSRSCNSFGSERIMEKISTELDLEPGESNDKYDLDYSGCLGYCSNSPNVLINRGHIVHDSQVETIMEKIKEGGEELEDRVLEIEDIDKKTKQYFDDYLDDSNK